MTAFHIDASVVTLVSRLAENPAVSEEAIKSLAGHVSQRMLERYIHIRARAKRAAIEALEQAANSGVAIVEVNPSKPQEQANFEERGHRIVHTQ
ncbi:MAG: hypothetical protein ACE145_02470 [Terriglobia bacterium]